MATMQLSRPVTVSRWEPFKVLFEAQYLPLLLLALPQSYNVYRWLYDTPGDWASWLFAIIGGAAFEAAYVGVIAWADRQAKGMWYWVTALLALSFSIAVAIHVHFTKQGYAAVLHAGFPAVAFAYTMIMHNASPVVDVQALSSQRDEALHRVAELERELTRRDAALLAAQSGIAAAVKDRDDARTLATKQQAQLDKAQQPKPISLDAVAAAVAGGALSLAGIVKAAAGGFPTKDQAAAALGMSRQTLSAWLDKAEVV